MDGATKYLGTTSFRLLSYDSNEFQCCLSRFYFGFCYRKLSPVVTDREKTDQGCPGNTKRTDFHEFQKLFRKEGISQDRTKSRKEFGLRS